MQNRLNTEQDEASSLKYFSDYFEWIYEIISYSWEFKKKVCKNQRIKNSKKF